MLAGIDVSNNQGRIDWTLTGPHVGFVIAKATQGTGFRDRWYEYNREGCHVLGVPFGAYHWVEPAEAYGVPHEIRQQIELFRTMVGNVHGDLLPVLDVETTPPGGGRRVGEPSPGDVAYAVQCVEELFGVTPMLYGGEPVLFPCARRRPEILRCRLWKAYYPGTNSGDPAVKVRGYGRLDPWDHLTMWQWTSRGALPGVHSSGLDLDDLYDPISAITVGGVDPVDPAEDEVGICIPEWAKAADPDGLLFPCYTWDGQWLRAWHDAPLPDWAGAKPNPMGLPCVEVDATGWLAGHAKAEGPVMSPDGAKVIVKRDDGAPLAYPTGMTNPPGEQAQLPPPQQIAVAVAPFLKAATTIAAG